MRTWGPCSLKTHILKLKHKNKGVSFKQEENIGDAQIYTMDLRKANIYIFQKKMDMFCCVKIEKFGGGRGTPAYATVKYLNREDN